VFAFRVAEVRFGAVLYQVFYQSNLGDLAGSDKRGLAVFMRRNVLISQLGLALFLDGTSGT
jgi:hypothetical protein